MTVGSILNPCELMDFFGLCKAIVIIVSRGQESRSKSKTFVTISASLGWVSLTGGRNEKWKKKKKKKKSFKGRERMNVTDGRFVPELRLRAQGIGDEPLCLAPWVLGARRSRPLPTTQSFGLLKPPTSVLHAGKLSKPKVVASPRHISRLHYCLH